MRKNKSVKDAGLSKGRRSQGRQISIDLDPALAKLQENSYRYNKHSESNQNTQRQDRSFNPISQNILKDIINYSHISNSNPKSTKGTTLVAYERHQDVLSQFSKINKKASLGQIGRRESQKLTLDYPMSGQVSMRSVQYLKENKSFQLAQSELFDVPRGVFEESKKESSSKKPSLASSVSKSQLFSLERQKEQLTAKLDQIQLLQSGIILEYSEMVSQWQQLMNAEKNSERESKKLADLQSRKEALRCELESSNEMLLNNSREFIGSRRRWDQRGNGARGKVLDEALFSHEQLLRRITIRDFEETVLFNMKVAIPDHKSKTSVRGIYEQLFHSKCTKKFTMILKKHASHMDLYDGKLLTDFTKRINDLEGQYSRCEGESTAHEDQPFLHKIEVIVCNIEQLKLSLEGLDDQKSKIVSELMMWREFGRECQYRIQQLIEEINSKVRGDYQKQTQKAADFRALLTEKYCGKYKEFKRVREEKEQTTAQINRLQSQLLRLESEI